MTDYHKDQCACYKYLLYRLQIYNIIQFLKDKNIGVAQKLFIRELWAGDQIELANDWIELHMVFVRITQS